MIVIILVITLFLILKKKSATKAMELESADSDNYARRSDSYYDSIGSNNYDKGGEDDYD